MHDNRLRPMERTILRLRSAGMSSPEIGRRVGKRPGTVERIFVMIDYKKDLKGSRKSSRGAITLVEEVVVRLRARGENHGEIGSRLGRSGAQIRRIESYISLKSS